MSDTRAGGELIDCAGFRDFEIWHLDYLDIQEGFPEIARAAQVCATDLMRRARAYAGCLHLLLICLPFSCPLALKTRMVLSM